MSDDDANDTQDEPRAPSARRRSLAGEFFEFLMENKKWWMIPIIVIVLLLALLLVFASTPAAPFMYPLF